jgi:hypothetical protein
VALSEVEVMQPRRGHAMVALLSVAGAVIAGGLTALSGDPRSPGTVLAVVLLANAAVRYRLATS